MAETLNVLLGNLRLIRTYLIKIGPSRRVGKILVEKKLEAEQVFQRFKSSLQIICSEKQVNKYCKEELSLIDKISKDFSILYEEIKVLCDNNSSTSTEMAGDNFDLKIALSILPILNDDDSVTKQLIESAEYYSSTLIPTEIKSKLIPFILKTRLSPRAKLKLKSSYDTINDLIRDMQLLLLPQKSHVALQTKLQQCRQNDNSIDDFGKELSELFVDLTVSQAQGNTENYDVLRPLNEKVAIKRFADGLRNRRLGTIITARNYSSLTEAVQAAKDEEVTGTPGTPDIMGMYRRPYRGASSYASTYSRSPSGMFRGRQPSYRGRRPFYRGYRRENNRTYTQVPKYNSYQSFDQQNSGGRGTGRYNHRPNYRNHSDRGRIHTMNEEQQADQVNNMQESLNHFFRA